MAAGRKGGGAYQASSPLPIFVKEIKIEEKVEYIE
jgi:hypothetical protein